MKKRKMIIILLVIAIILIAIGGIIYFIPSNNKTNGNAPNKAMSDEEASQYIDQLTDVIINGGTREELVSVLHSDEILDTYIMTGEDMYLLQRPDDKTIEKYSLEEYVKASEELAKKFEAAIQNNFEYNITNINADDEYTTVEISYRTYYYNAYINDLSVIQNELLVRAGYDFENLSDSEQLQVDVYKAKIKAASILDNYLNNYINENEVNNTVVSYINNRIEDSGEDFVSYLINLTGFTYDNSGNITTEEDLNNLLANYDLTNPLAL